VFSGGEIIAGPDGEALLAELVRFKQAGAYEGEAADPVVYKTPEEAALCYNLIQNIDDTYIKKLLNLKKLEKAINMPGYFDGVDKDEVISDLCDALNRLRDFYQHASGEKLCPVLFSITCD
jgi:hypothetical protein